MEEIYDVIKSRHSVRSYTDKKIEGNVKEELEELIKKCNNDVKLNIKLVLNESKAFDTFMAHYGKFDNVKNYIVMSGKKSNDLEEKCGYYGEMIVIKAQELGLNTCWVGLTYNKKFVRKEINGEKIVVVIAIGYGKTNGVEHKIKSYEDVVKNKGNTPEWFKKGIEYALLAPTALNQQKFIFDLVDENEVEILPGNGFYTRVDMGIAKYHFELGARLENFRWKK